MPPVKQDPFEWATSPYAYKVAPPLEKQQKGWTAGERPPAGWLNWFFNQMSQWSTWIDGNFNDYLVSNSLLVRYFGNGVDGDVTINTTVTLSRDMYYRNLTFGASGIVLTNGYRVFVQQTLDVSTGGIFLAHASASVYGFGNNGSSSGATQSAVAAAGGGTYSAGGAGGSGIGNGANGAGAAGSAGTSIQYSIGGVGGSGGVGGAGTGGAGGAAGAAGALTSPIGAYLDRANPLFYMTNSSGLHRSAGAPGGGGGGAGGGDGSNKGGGGGGGGAGAGNVHVCARTIQRGSGSPFGGFYARGGDGGAGGNPASANRGSGGGGAGGGGGSVFLCVAELLGSTLTNIVNASGGDGGASASSGTRCGAGGRGGDSGLITIIDLSNTIGLITVGPVAGAAGGAAGAASAAGGVGGVCRASL